MLKNLKMLYVCFIGYALIGMAHGTGTNENISMIKVDNFTREIDLNKVFFYEISSKDVNYVPGKTYPARSKIYDADTKQTTEEDVEYSDLSFRLAYGPPYYEEIFAKENGIQILKTIPSIKLGTNPKDSPILNFLTMPEDKSQLTLYVSGTMKVKGRLERKIFSTTLISTDQLGLENKEVEDIIRQNIESKPDFEQWQTRLLVVELYDFKILDKGPSFKVRISRANLPDKTLIEGEAVGQEPKGHFVPRGM